MDQENKKPEVEKGASYSWDPKADITIKGIEFDYLQKYLQPYEILIEIKNKIFERMVSEGIATKMEQPEGLDKKD